ncbi:MAG: hypothetical protein AB8F65_09385 [Woeseiaceae bacterium]
MQRLRLIAIIGLWSLSTHTNASRQSTADTLVEYQTQTGVSVTGLDAASLDTLNAGETVYRTVKLSGDTGQDSTIIRIVGYRLIDAARESLWLSALAYDGNYSKRLTEHLVGKTASGDALWYQHVNMPWPLRNRHWLISTRKNIELTRTTEGAIWEHQWELATNSRQQIAKLARRKVVPGLSSEDFRKSILVPRNNGAWMMAETKTGKTLVVIHATMDMGGMIPDALVARSTKKQLMFMLEKIEQDSQSIWQTYDDRYPIVRGDGTLIEPITPTR